MDQAQRSELRHLIQAFPETKIAIIGDLILDQFIWGKVSRISPEAPVPVVEVTRESEHLGGAANVALNLVALGAIPLLVGVIGEDPAADLFEANLQRAGIGGEGLVIDPTRRTTVKTRIIAQHQQVCRTDRECRAPLSSAIRQALLQKAREAVQQCDAVIISDYAKGVIDAEHTMQLIQSAKDLGRFVAVDPKVADYRVYRGASIITPNKHEAELASGISIDGPESLEKAAQRILALAQADNLLITRGEDGMSLFEGARCHHIPTVAREVYDVTGAGDTVIANLTLGVAAGAALPLAALLANHAAGVVVGKLGTATASPLEILESLNGD